MTQRVRTVGRPRTKTYTAWRNGDEIALIEAVIAKYAKTLDACESARDIKPLASGMFEAIDRLNAIKAANVSEQETPLAKILDMPDLKAAAGE